MTRTISLTKYLFTRLKQQGLKEVFGVPGDFTLKSIDHAQELGLRWIGNCNELSAGYAADGYARSKGLAVLSTTLGVGELSAINATACSYAEHVPVVHVVGSPARPLQESTGVIHHTLGDGRNKHVFMDLQKSITVACTALWDAHSAPKIIDDTIVECLRQSRPVYIDLPCDMVSEEVPEERLDEALKIEVPTDSGEEDRQVQALVGVLQSAQHPLFLVDCGQGVRHMKPEINRLVQASKIPTLTMPSGAGMIDHSHRSYFGVHAGPVGKIDTMPLMNSADVVVNIGGMFSDTQSLGWSTLPPPEKTITITSTSITFPNSTAPTPINARRLLTKLAVAVQPASRNRSLLDIPDFRALRPPSDNLSERIDQDSLYLRLNPYLRPNDTILLANSTPIIGGRDFILPPGAQVIASGVAFSVGHMLPASLGAALAQRSRPPERRGRTILFVGDGSLQATVQEIGTVIRYRLDLTIFILNNGGYAYERHIHGLEKEYNDIASWRYTDLPKAFGAPVGDKEYPVETHVVETWGDLERLVGDEEFCSGRGLRLVDVRVGKYDVPEKFKPVFRAAAEKL